MSIFTSFISEYWLFCRGNVHKKTNHDELLQPGTKYNLRLTFSLYELLIKLYIALKEINMLMKVAELQKQELLNI